MEHIKQAIKEISNVENQINALKKSAELKFWLALKQLFDNNPDIKTINI